MKTKLSICIITYNEAHIIEKCLKQLTWADEIIVVDSGSTDNTVEICKKYTAKVIYHPFENFGLQKQFALNQCTNDWVLSLDADEILTPNLIQEINQLDFDCAGYLVPRTHVFLNKIFKYGAETKRPYLRLFNKKLGGFTPNKVHETIEVNGEIKKLKNDMLHYTVFDLKTAINKQIKYALLSGEFMHEKQKKTSLLKIVFKFPFDFIRYYFLQRNFLNGYHGFTWSIFSAFCSYLKYAYLKELNQTNS